MLFSQVAPSQGRRRVFSALVVLVTTLLLYRLHARLFFDTSLRAMHPYGLAYVVVVGLLTLLGAAAWAS